MPKKKNTKNRKNPVVQEERKIDYKGDGEEYGLVTKKLGNGRFLIKLQLKETEVIGRICGRMKRGRNKHHNWVEEGSVVLVGLRDFQDDRVDIIHVYEESQVRSLKKSGEYIEETEIERNVIKREEEEFVYDFEDI